MIFLEHNKAVILAKILFKMSAGNISKTLFIIGLIVLFFHGMIPGGFLSERQEITLLSYLASLGVFAFIRLVYESDADFKYWEKRTKKYDAIIKEIRELSDNDETSD
jgi:hypothetical protein